MNKYNYPRAKQVLQSLIQGIDPQTGAELSKDTVLNRVDVVRALLSSVDAIEQVTARAARRANLPPSVGKSWTPEEERALVTEFQAGDAPADIATKHGRTLRAIEARLEHLGIITAAERTTSLLFVPNVSKKEEQVNNFTSHGNSGGIASTDEGVAE
jgi:hypothetical protein